MGSMGELGECGNVGIPIDFSTFSSSLQSAIEILSGLCAVIFHFNTLVALLHAFFKTSRKWPFSPGTAIFARGAAAREVRASGHPMSVPYHNASSGGMGLLAPKSKYRSTNFNTAMRPTTYRTSRSMDDEVIS